MLVHKPVHGSPSATPAAATPHLHLVSDSTGETLDAMAKAGLAHFEDGRIAQHLWPMVRTAGHLDRVLGAIKAQAGLVLYTVVDPELRLRLERQCLGAGLTAIPVLDTVVGALSHMLGLPVSARPGRQHVLDAAYFARVDAIQFSIAHDDGIGADNWEEADILLAGVSRTSKTPTAIYLANRGYKVANLPLVPTSPPPAAMLDLRHPMVVGLTTSPERLIQIRRNRLLTLGQQTETDYVDVELVMAELAHARRLFADRGWPVIDVTRRSIEETAAAIIKLHTERTEGALA